MTDLQSMSDEELKALYGQSNPLANMSDEDLKKAYGQVGPSVAQDVAASGVTGVGRGLANLFGSPADYGDTAAYYRDKYLTNPIVSALGGKPYSEEQLSKTPAADVAGSAPINKFIQKVGGEYHEPQTTAGKYAESIGEFLPSAVAAPGSITSNAIRYGLLPGVASEAAGQATAGTKYEPYAKVAAAAGSTLINPSRAVTPLPTSEMRQQFVKTLQDEGITSLTAGQKTGNEALRYLESASSAAPMAGHKASEIQGLGQQQFTEAAMRRAGAGPDASPEVLGSNQKRLGGEFERLSKQNSLVPDDQFIGDLTKSVKDYRNVPESQQKNLLQGYIDDIIPHVNNGHMPGEMYQEMRSRLTSQAKAYRSTDPALGQALGGLRDSLDNAMFRSIAPEDAQAWQLARKQYAAQKVLEKAASRAGEATAEGQITPANLRNTVSSENRGVYARGEGQFSDLARAGSAVMYPLPNSGTAQRLNAFHILNSATLGAVPALTGRAIMSTPVQNYLANQLIRGSALPANPTAKQLMLIESLQKLRNDPTSQVQ